jgi:hypothetical protein
VRDPADAVLDRRMRSFGKRSKTPWKIISVMSGIV